MPPYAPISECLDPTGKPLPWADKKCPGYCGLCRTAEKCDVIKEGKDKGKTTCSLPCCPNGHKDRKPASWCLNEQKKRGLMGKPGYCINENQRGCSYDSYAHRWVIHFCPQYCGVCKACPAPPPPKCIDNPFQLDFEKATIKHNNLGGMGPNSASCGSAIDDPQELRYDSIATLNNRGVAMVVKGLSPYNPNQGACGKGSKANGIAGKFGRINLGNHQKFTALVQFIYMDDSTPAEIPDVDFTFYDFDHGTLSYGTNSKPTAMVNDPSKVFAKGDALVPCSGTPGPAQSYSTLLAVEQNENGLDGVIERIAISGYSKYYIENEGKMCIPRTSTTKDAIKVMVPDSSPASSTTGSSPVGDPSFFWLQDEDYYCNTAKAPTNPGWMYTNYPCTEVYRGSHLGMGSTFESTIRGYGCDNPKDPRNLDPIARARAVTVKFEKKSNFTITYEIESTSCYSYMTGGRNFLFTGIGQSKCKT
jgi:hypothetical protein